MYYVFSEASLLFVKGKSHSFSNSHMNINIDLNLILSQIHYSRLLKTFPRLFYGHVPHLSTTFLIKLKERIYFWQPKTLGLQAAKWRPVLFLFFPSSTSLIIYHCGTEAESLLHMQQSWVWSLTGWNDANPVSWGIRVTTDL